jgi:hypothetical protein
MKTFVRGLLFFVVAALSFQFEAFSQISITGVNNRGIYTDQATFQVSPQAGFTYTATLNGKTVPLGVSVVVERMDHYELIVTATPSGGGTPVSQLVQFIVRDSDRGSPETGLIKWVPYPPIPSGDDEFAGAQLEVIYPPRYPVGLHVPIIARVTDAQGNARRVNGTVRLQGSDFQSFRLVRGLGFGLSQTTNVGSFTFGATVGPLEAGRVASIEPTTWTPVSGILGSVNSWTEDSRISVNGNLTVPAGGILEIEAGTVIRLMPGVNITNNGRILIRGSTANPVVFTSTNRVAPEVHTGAWGGFVMRNSGAEIIGTGAIFTGSGAASSFSFSPGTSHRSEQALFLAQTGTRIFLTNCFAINNAGQIANGYNADVTYDHCLMQRAITCGEYVGGTIIVNHSAVIEFPSIDDVYNAQIADSDYDAIYFTTGTHILANSLFGFCKDDAIDSGSGGAGTVVVSNCWVESALHEGMAWSGGGRRTWTYDTVAINNGQGFECGWSEATNSPLCVGDRLLSIANSVGARYGDNYEGTSGLGLKGGFLWVTNSIVLHNYRDVWGRVWDNTWGYRVNDMDIRSNFLTTANTNHPTNSVWNPVTDANRLVPFMKVPPNAAVGVGLAVWSSSQPVINITNGVPVRLSTFTPHPVSVTYSITGPSGPVSDGRLEFSPGETLKQIPVSIGSPQTYSALRVSLNLSAGAQLSGLSEAWYLNLPTPPGPTTTTLIPRGATWKYLDTGVNAGTVWRETTYDDSAWAAGPAELGFGDGGEATVISFGPDPAMKYITTYFRHAFNVANPSSFATLNMWLLRDDAGVVYINGSEIFRSPNMPPGTITSSTLSVGSSAENAIDTTTVGAGVLRTGANVAAVEIHQQAIDSSDLSFNFELTGVAPAPPPRVEVMPFGDDLLLFWSEPSYLLEESAAITGPWTVAATASPYLVTPEGTKFYRLRK